LIDLAQLDFRKKVGLIRLNSNFEKKLGWGGSTHILGWGGSTHILKQVEPGYKKTYPGSTCFLENKMSFRLSVELWLNASGA